MVLITLESNPNSRTTIAGKIFAELLSKKILSMAVITQGYIKLNNFITF
jgi:translation initiation factor 4G